MDEFLPVERLETPRFVLRSFLAGDGPQIYEAVNESADHLYAYLQWGQRYERLYDAEMFARQARARYLNQSDFLLSVWSPDETELWGGTGFRTTEGPATGHRAEISMWIRVSQAGQGLGTEVLQTMIRWGFTEWHWRRLCWRCRPDNHGSARTAERAGMTLAATFRKIMDDHHGGPNVDERYYEILKSEWQG
jgi:ribosomal-protein-serine acetyltransferase